MYYLDQRSLAKIERGVAGLGLLKNTVFLQALKVLESFQHLSPVVMQESRDKIPALSNIDGPGPAQSRHHPGTQALSNNHVLHYIPMPNAIR